MAYSLPARATIVRLALALALLAPVGGGPLTGYVAGVAYADDGDDGGGAGVGAAGGFGGSVRPRGNFTGNPLRALRRFVPDFGGRQRPRRARPNQAAAALPDRAEAELVAFGLGDADLARLVGAGFSVLERSDLAALGLAAFRLRIPEGRTLEDARTELVALAGAAVADFNHFYRPETGTDDLEEARCEGPHCAAPRLIGWPQAAATCGRDLRLGLIDTAINPAHDTFARARIDVHRLSQAERDESGRQHGTAVAALLVGGAGSRTPGLLPQAALFAVDAFHRGAASDDRADVYSLVRAIDHLAARDVAVLNMSLAGPDNAVLRKAVADASTAGIVIVAAVGNGGPKAGTAFPAGYPEVIAVTAVDAGKRAYRRAGRGAHVDFAAPGVNVWTAASVSGARPKTGTSFAAPFVAAAAALLKAAEPELTSAGIIARLSADAEDLGEAGRDDVFGWGLVRAGAYCGAPGPVPVAARP